MAMRHRVGLTACAAILAGLILSRPALAYRPFDGTDAAVADVHEVEIELQPAGVEHSPGQKTLIAPHIVYNFGFIKDWELVLESQLETPLSPSGPSTWTSSGAFLKHVLRPGSLQDRSGPSVATEFGVLLPDTHGPGGTGASVATIISQRWDWGTLHLNVEGIRTRDQHAGAFTSVILEGPSKWKVRPVAEVSYEETFGQTHAVAGLVGAIWQVRDKLSFDVALKHSVSNTGHADEVRAGLTFGFSVSHLGDPNHR
jgi:hypothetical protein